MCVGRGNDIVLSLNISHTTGTISISWTGPGVDYIIEEDVLIKGDVIISCYCVRLIIIINFDPCLLIVNYILMRFFKQCYCMTVQVWREGVHHVCQHHTH